MFGRLKKKIELKEPKVTEEPKLTEKPTATKKPQKNLKRTRKPAKAAEDTGPQSPQIHADLKEAEKPFVGIKEYSSASEIAEKIDNEIAETKSTLGEYLRQLEYLRYAAANAAGKKREQIDVNGLGIVVDSTPLNELIAMESVVRSHAQRLTTLKMAKEALEPLDHFRDIEGIKYLVLEKEGIPEQILVKT